MLMLLVKSVLIEYRFTLFAVEVIDKSLGLRILIEDRHRITYGRMQAIVKFPDNADLVRQQRICFINNAEIGLFTLYQCQRQAYIAGRSQMFLKLWPNLQSF